MEARLFLFLLTILLVSIYAQPQQLPMYIGSGYNVITGNPLVNSRDPGILQSLFQFHYTKGITTEDGKYLIPDEVYHRKSSSCSLSSQTEIIRGGDTYKK